jgi:hypothetical protein
MPRVLLLLHCWGLLLLLLLLRLDQALCWLSLGLGSVDVFVIAVTLVTTKVLSAIAGWLFFLLLDVCCVLLVEA